MIQPFYLSIKDLQHLTGLGRTTIYRRVKDGTFPKPVKIGTRACWVRDEVFTAFEALKSRRPT